MKALLKKELFSYATSPAVFVVLFFFELTLGVLFFIVQQFFIQGDSSLRQFFVLIPYISIIFIPSITMGVWAEEIHSGTADILYALPITEFQLVFAKYSASCILFFAAQIFSLPIPLFVSFFGAVDFVQVLISYIGIMCFACASIAVGNFISVISKNQITAFILTSLILILFNSAHIFPLLLSLNSFSSMLCNQFSFAWHFDSFSKGIIDSRNIIFFASIAFIFLLLTVYTVTRRKWK